MNTTWWNYGGRIGAVALVGLTASVSRADDETQDAPKPEQGIEIEIESPTSRFRVGERRPITLDDVTPRTVKLSDYWLGLDCSEISPAMRSQLKLGEGEGLVIDNVMPDSPAAKAGFQQHDVLLSAGDQPIKDVEKLMAMLDENKDRDVAFSVLRGGEKLGVTAKPEKRPRPEGSPRDRLRWLAGDGEKAMEILKEQLKKGGMPLRMQFFHPGMVVRGDAKMAEFPDDLHVHIRKEGNTPAKIVVERNDKKWEISEDKLNELPDDVRPHVESLLGRMPMPKFDVEIDGASVAEAIPFNIPLPPQGELGRQIEERLESMSRSIEQMRKQLNEIRDERRQSREERRDNREEHRNDREDKPRAGHKDT